MPIIEHETSPAIAVRIARCGKFCAGPILGDSGMNALIVDHAAGPYASDQAAERGALMRFDWSGPVGSGTHVLGYPPNELQDQHPHRALVPVGTNRFLRLVGIRLTRGSSWKDAVVEPRLTPTSVIPWLLSKKAGWKQRQADLIGNEMRAIVAQKRSISVVFPPHCIYASTVMEQYPNHAWPN